MDETSRYALAYLDLEVGVQQELELEALLALISHGDDSLELVLAQGNTVYETKVERPCLASFVAETLATQAKVELDGLRLESILNCGFAEELPARCTSESVLGERRRSMSGLGRRAKDL